MIDIQKLLTEKNFKVTDSSTGISGGTSGLLYLIFGSTIASIASYPLYLPKTYDDKSQTITIDGFHSIRHVSDTGTFNDDVLEIANQIIKFQNSSTAISCTRMIDKTQPFFWDKTDIAFHVRGTYILHTFDDMWSSVTRSGNRIVNIDFWRKGNISNLINDVNFNSKGNYKEFLRNAQIVSTESLVFSDRMNALKRTFIKDFINSVVINHPEKGGEDNDINNYQSAEQYIGTDGSYFAGISLNGIYKDFNLVNYPDMQKKVESLLITLLRNWMRLSIQTYNVIREPATQTLTLLYDDEEYIDDIKMRRSNNNMSGLSEIVLKNYTIKQIFINQPDDERNKLELNVAKDYQERGFKVTLLDFRNIQDIYTVGLSKYERPEIKVLTK